MPSKFSYVFILLIAFPLLLVSLYIISEASTDKALIKETRRLEMLPIAHLRTENPSEYVSRSWKIENDYTTQLNLKIFYRETAAWAVGIFSILLLLLGLLDFRLYRRRLSSYQKMILVTLVENNIDSLLEKRDNNVFTDKHGNRNNEKWHFEKSLFIENVLYKENTGRLLFNNEKICTMIDEIIDGTLK